MMRFRRPPVRVVRTALGALAALAAAGGLAAPAAAQVTGARVTVEARAAGRPVSGAEVLAAYTRGVTDAGGRAVLWLRPGLARIEVRAPGLAPAEVTVEVVAGRDTTVVVALWPEGVVPGGELVVMATRAGRRVQDEPLRVELIGREEIEEKSLMTPGDIAMLLNEAGGLRVQVTSPALGAATVRVQGMRGRYTQLLADGLPLYGGQTGSIGLLQIPPTDLDQVEVIKGVASSLYGGSALGGVINLVSRRPADRAEAEFLLNGTSQEGRDGVAYASGPIRNGLGYSVLAGYHRQGAWDADFNGWADVPAHDRFTVRPRLFLDDDAGRSVFLTAGAMTETREGGTVAGRTLPDGSPFPESLETERVDGGALARLPVGSRFLTLRGSGMVQRHRHRFGDVSEADRHATAFLEGGLSGTDGAHTWVLGLALQRDEYRSGTFPAFDYAFTVPAVFAQDEYRVSTDLSISASARLDVHDAYGARFSPRVAVLFRPGAWVARASAGTGFFAPTPLTEATEAAGLSRFEPPVGLRAERARSASLDLGRSLGPVELNATLFGSVVEDAVQVLPRFPPAGPPEPPVRLVNVPGETRTAGTELLARWRRDGLTVTGSHMFVRAREPDPTGDPGGPGRDVPLTPRHAAGVVAMWEEEAHGRLGLEVYYTGRQDLGDNPYRSESEPYWHLGVLLELRRETAGVFINFENLLDVRQTRYDPLVRPFRAVDGRWTVDAWAPLEGFVVNAGVRMRFRG